jgi:exonuclease III
MPEKARTSRIAPLRIICWNMDHWRRSAASRAEAWRWLDKENPDLALLQESAPGPRREAVYRRKGIDNSRHWGSAVVSSHLRLEEVSEAKGREARRAEALHRTFPGCLAIAKASVEGKILIAISIYGLIDNEYAQTTMHRLLSDLTPLLDSGRRDRWRVMGGDLNVSTQLPQPYGTWSRTIFQRIADFGLVDLTRKAAKMHDRPGLTCCTCTEAECRHVQTARHRTGSRYQNDYLFASEGLAERLVDCWPLSGGHPDPWKLSDHRPLLAEFAASHRSGQRK